MLNPYDGPRVYYFNPEVSQEENDKDWSKISWIQFHPSVVDKVPADKIAEFFLTYGDFNVFKDSSRSCYLEFYYFDPA